MIYDVIIVGAGAAGLFTGIHLDKKINKLILEKTDKIGTKVLLSGGERANVSNMDIEPTRDYFSQNIKFLISIFSKFNQWDTMSFFSEKGINIIEEDRGRLILESGNSRELVDCLINESRKNKCEIKLNSDVKDIILHYNQNQDIPHLNPLPKGEGNNIASSLPWGEIEREIYEIITKDGKKYKAKNVIVSSGGKSFFQVGTSGEGYNFAEKLGIKVIPPYRALCGLTTKKDFKELSGSSMDLGLKLVDNKITHPGIPSLNSNGRRQQIIYQEYGPLLFTHFGISGPTVFNTANALGEYLNSINIDSEQDKIKYILENIIIELDIDKQKTTKKIYSFFKEQIDNEEKISFGLQDWRSWKEAKATGGGIDTNQLDNNVQSKKYKGLYFIGEVVDITGKTGGYNLQWAWSSAYVSSKNINKNLK